MYLHARPQMMHASAGGEVAEGSIVKFGTLLDIPRVQGLIAHDADWYNANKGGEAFFPGMISPSAHFSEQLWSPYRLHLSPSSQMTHLLPIAHDL